MKRRARPLHTFVAASCALGAVACAWVAGLPDFERVDCVDACDGDAAEEDGAVHDARSETGAVDGDTSTPDAAPRPVLCPDRACGSGEACCAVAGQDAPSCVPTGRCTSGTLVGCTDDRSCAEGLVCCGVYNFAEQRVSVVQCQAAECPNPVCEIGTACDRGQCTPGAPGAPALCL